MELCVEIETFDKKLDFDLFYSGQLSSGSTEKILSDGVSIKYNWREFKRSYGLPDIVNITIVIGQNVVIPIAVGILSNYFYEKLKNRLTN